MSRAHEIQFSVKFLVFFWRENLCLFPFYSDLDIKKFVQLIIKHTLSRRVVLNYETKWKRNERNETKRNETKYYATKYTKMRNETQRSEIYSNAKRNATKRNKMYTKMRNATKYTKIQNETKIY